MRETNRFGLGVIVCVFNKQFSKLLLVKRNKEKRRRWGATWGNIGGKIEFGEASLQSAIRELKEETGIKLEPAALKLISVKETPNLFPHWHGAHFVYAAAIDERTKIIVNYESDSYEWFSINKLPHSILDEKSDIIEWRKVAKDKFHGR
jgi:ADP-ribose pyrophosphatase YjhB (NUDIX family)